jgi:hypothetical protein
MTTCRIIYNNIFWYVVFKISYRLFWKLEHSACLLRWISNYQIYISTTGWRSTELCKPQIFRFNALWIRSLRIRNSKSLLCFFFLLLKRSFFDTFPRKLVSKTSVNNRKIYATRCNASSYTVKNGSRYLIPIRSYSKENTHPSFFSKWAFHKHLHVSLEKKKEKKKIFLSLYIIIGITQVFSCKDINLVEKDKEISKVLLKQVQFIHSSTLRE